MNKYEKTLASRLLYLPLDVHEKVLLWLAFRGLKPVSEITVERRNMAQLRRGIRTQSTTNVANITRISKWIHDAGLFYETEIGHPGSWHLGKDKSKVLVSTKILHRYDYKNELKSGSLFGFPKESVEAYAHNRTVKPDQKKIPMISPFNSTNEFLKNKYYSKYMFYSVRADRVKEDSKVARLWADTIRKEVPVLAEWFEKSN